MGSKSAHEIIELLKGKGITLFVKRDQLGIKTKKSNTVPEDILATIKSNKEELISFLKKEKDTSHNRIKTTGDYGLPTTITNKKLWDFLKLPVHKGEISNIFPLTPLQKGFLFHNLYNENASSYVSQFHCDLKGVVSKEAFEKSWKYLMKKHTVLRTAVFGRNLDIPIQCVYDEVPLPLQELDYSNLSNEDSKSACNAFLVEDRKAGFSFEAAPLFRLTLINLGEVHTRFVFTGHHIILDGWSVQNLIAGFYSCYVQLEAGKTLPELEVDNFGEHIRHISTIDETEGLSYWKNYLSKLTAPSYLPFLKNTAHRNKIFGESKMEISISGAIKEYTNKYRITKNTLIQGAWSFLLSKYTGYNEVVFGATISGRNLEEENIESKVGLYLNTIPVVSTIDGDKRVSDWLQELQGQHTIGREEYGHLGINEIESQSNVKRALFDSVITFQNFPEATSSPEFDTKIEVKNIEGMESSNYALSLIVYSTENNLKIVLQYNDELVANDVAIKIKGHLEVLLESLLKDTEYIKDLDYITKAEEHQLFNEFNNTKKDYLQDNSLLEIFSETVASYPDRVALVFGNEKLTYSDLNRRSNQVAHYLLSEGIVPGNLVGLLFDRSVEMIVGILGILKSGAGYLPLDPGLPERRIDYMLKKAKIAFLLTQQYYLDKAPNPISKQAIDAPIIYSQSTAKVPVCISAMATAYCIFTSGSTGEPKGVMMSHKAVINLVLGLSEEVYGTYGKKPLNVGLLASFSFDASVQQVFGALLQGHCLYIADDESRKDGTKLRSFYNSNQIDISDGTPTHLRMLVESAEEGSALNSLSSWILAGEVLPKGLVKAFYSKLGNKTQLYNFYGPTEACVDSTCYKIVQDRLNEYDSIPIGKPLPNERVYITDRDGRPVPIGAIGELCIAGDGLAQCYIENDSLTAEKFTSNWLMHEDKVYRTGDMARWLPDGNLEYYGRKDNQIKLRGYRIELSEIEYQLNTFRNIENGIVLIKTIEKEQHLVAYYQAGEKIDVSEIRKYLSAILPDYMIPSYYVHIEEFPLTINGKIDGKALPKPKIGGEEKHMGPSNEMEEKLIGIYAEVLKLDSSVIGVDSNFFDLGGHSLSMIFLSNRIQKEFEVKISLKEMMKHPTVASISKLIPESSKGDHLDIAPKERKEYYELSSSQKRIYFLHEYSKNSLAYNIPVVVSLKGKLDKERLQGAFQQLIQRHNSLRTLFDVVDGHPMQRILPKVDFSITEIENTGNLKETITNFIRPFDLSKAPLWRTGIISLSNQEHLLLIDTHHIISDEVTNQILLKDLTSIYKRKLLPELRVQYEDYVQWQLEERQQEEIAKHKEYWFDKFSDEVPTLQLPYDFPRPKDRSDHGGNHVIKLSQKRLVQLKKMARSEGVTMYSLIMAIYNVLLSKLSSQNDIVVGTPVAGREHVDLESITGIFINTLAIRNTIDHNTSFKSFLGRVQEGNTLAFDHQLYPFEELIDALNLQMDTSRTPLFDAHLSYAFEKEKIDLGDPELEITVVDVPYAIAKFDLALSVIETNENLILDFSYCKALFKKSNIERFASYFVRIVDSVLKDGNQLLRNIEILSQKEEQQLLTEFNASDIAYDLDKNVLGMFEEQVRKTPQAVALTFNGERVTYEELDIRSDQWASCLIEKGIVKGDVIGLLMDRSMEMITSILATLKTGAAYLPIDPNQPVARTEHMLEDSDSKLIITNLKDSPLTGKVNIEMVNPYILDQYSANVVKKNNVPLLPDDLVYIIYTSGSTGRPKGVKTHHGSVSNLIFCQRDNFGINATDKILQSSPYHFDASVEQIWLALANGGELVISENPGLLDTTSLNKILKDNEITHLHNTPSFLERIDLKELKALRRVVAGGEICNTSLAKKIASSYDFYNEYGPTETTVTSVMYQVRPEMDQLTSVPIGKPIANTKVFILDGSFNLVPIGVTGELFISGKGVSTGYVNRKEKTEECFIKNPYGDGILYKTGDLAKWLPDGNLVCLGRSDNQVKLNGVRIELGEIESHLKAFKGIFDAAVVLKEIEGQPSILAYYISEDKFSNTALRTFLMERLPLGMIPNYYVRLESFPLTSSGKLAKKMLPVPEIGGSSHRKAETETERKLAEIWSDILRKDFSQISVDSSFFELGGNSLKAIILCNMLNKQFSVEVVLKALFQHQTIFSLARYIETMDEARFESIPVAPLADYYPLSSAQQRMFFLYQYNKASLAYNPVMAVKLKGRLDLKKLEQTFNTLISRHESFRTSFGFLNGVPIQRIAEQVEFSISYLEAGEDIDTVIKDFIVPFDLDKAPLIRVGIMRISEEEHVMVINNHHIISDGVSDGILLNEFMAVYKGESLPPLNLQYKDYSVWQNSETYRKNILSHKEYWLNLLEGDLPDLELPTDYTRPEIRSSKGGLVTFEFDKQITAKLTSIAKEEKTTLFVILLGLYNILLGKLSNDEDIIVGTSVSGRNHADLEGLVGVFINALALRNFPKGNLTYNEFLRSVKRGVLSAFEHQDYPFEDLIEALNLKRDTSRTPLFNAMFEYFNFEQPNLVIPGLTLELFDYEVDVTRFDLTLGVIEVEDRLSFRFQYSSDLFDSITIERFVDYFRRLTNTVLEDRSILLKDINLLSITEQNELVSSFNFEELSYDKDSSLVDIFKEKASLYPDRIAVQYGQEYITYKELDVRSNKLAHYLRSKNIVYGNVVALLLDRSIDMIVGILGVLKSGAAYMPIDPSLPEQRIGYMLDQSRSSFLLAEHKYMETYSAYLPVASINDAMLSSQPKEEVLVRVTTSDLAYCIFTSGSSGKPKGVMMSQGSVVNLVKGLEQNVYSKYKEENLKVALLASYAFDASVQQIFGSLLLGHSLIIADDQSRKDGLKLREFYNTNDIDISDGTPTHMRLLVNAIQRGQSLPYLRSWILAGEVLPKELVVSFFKKVGSSVQLYNFYGPTETCVDSTFFKVNPEKLDRYETIPIGKPLPNERVYVTNKYGKLVPKGVRGELCIAGSGLARCYAGNQELTSECFVANWLPWESRVYRTGDIVKWLSDGNLEYCGRMDNQVKLRGYRIELSEIAYELNGIEAIRQSVVMIKEKNGENVLVGYYEAQEEIMVNDLRKRLAKILPQYMIPNYFVHVEKFPVSMSGKINTNSLPDYELCQSKAHVPPSNEIERQLVAIWSDILKIDKEVIGVTTDFFDLGGHSLSGIQMANNISEYFGVNLKLVEIFRKRTIQEISELIEMNRWLDSGSGGNTATTRKETVI